MPGPPHFYDRLGHSRPSVPGRLPCQAGPRHKPSLVTLRSLTGNRSPAGFAQRSHALRPAHSHGHQSCECYANASGISTPRYLLQLLPAGAVAGRGLHRLESAAFSRRTPKAAVYTVALPPNGPMRSVSGAPWAGARQIQPPTTFASALGERRHRVSHWQATLKAPKARHAR